MDGGILFKGDYMIFHGFQKMTLLDYPNKVACTLFTGGCNFRCPFCHNASLVTHIGDGEVYSENEVLDYLEKRKGLLDGVCISGGEPLLQGDIPEFLSAVKKLGYSTKLDTNGSFPDKLADLAKSGLVDYVAMDIKNCKEKYALTAGVPDLDIESIEKSVDFLLGGDIDFEFRTTVVKQFHTVDDIKAIGEWIKGAPRYFLQNFVDSGDLIGGGLEPVDRQTLEKMQDVVCGFVDFTKIRGI